MDQPFSLEEAKRKILHLEGKLAELESIVSKCALNLGTTTTSLNSVMKVFNADLDEHTGRLDFIERLVRLGWLMAKNNNDDKFEKAMDNLEDNYEGDEDNPHGDEEYTRNDLCRIAEESPEDIDLEEPPPVKKSPEKVLRERPKPKPKSAPKPKVNRKQLPKKPTKTKNTK